MAPMILICKLFGHDFVNDEMIPYFRRFDCTGVNQDEEYEAYIKPLDFMRDYYIRYGHK
jgi:hypothetical protein